MTIRSATVPFPARIKTELQIDPVLLTIVLALLMGGFVILASASISVSDNATNNPFFYVQRQLLAAAIGGASGVIFFFISLPGRRSLGPVMLLPGVFLLIFLLFPGVGGTGEGVSRKGGAQIA